MSFDIGNIELPQQARTCKKLQGLAASATRVDGDIVGDKVLLYGLLGIVARLEVAVEQDANLRKALSEVFPERLEGP